MSPPRHGGASGGRGARGGGSRGSGRGGGSDRGHGAASAPGIRARKRFGQHFLHDPNVVARIVHAIDPRDGDRLVEIGPGLGALTLPLLDRAQRLEVVEIDRDVIPVLRERAAGRGELVVHEADALEFDFAALRADGPRLRLAGNLPYNISTPLLFHLLDAADAIVDMHFMLQKEVVDRMAARPDTGDYGRLTVMLAARCAVEKLFDVGPGAFRPPPRVDSSIVRLRPHAEPPFAVPDPARFARVVAAAFGQRRKTLRNALQGLVDAPGFEAAGVDPGRRAETLAPAEYGALARTPAPAAAGP
ncbi:MAG: 16S rRNA (adenine(1518)-N(6)/adenine(1519)-N(6))-dimethyltransferase RsmA [Steroidobacteraceae bacterium]|nr:16S rRNA (adenine(1518)-N(6)/adenine(1519)-N(6))-dimethyltransferase RsmA [Steroidobacteraceae bacterium]